MDKKQLGFLVIGFCFFISVIYTLSLNTTARKSSLSINDLKMFSRILTGVSIMEENLYI